MSKVGMGWLVHDWRAVPLSNVGGNRLDLLDLGSITSGLSLHLAAKSTQFCLSFLLLTFLLGLALYQLFELHAEHVLLLLHLVLQIAHLVLEVLAEVGDQALLVPQQGAVAGRRLLRRLQLEGSSRSTVHLRLERLHGVDPWLI